MCNNLTVQDVNIEENYVESKQSANVLFKFMKKLEYLEEILEKKAIPPRYYEESIEYLELEGWPKITFPMICFCDINISRLIDHVQYYGKFGIGLKKQWGINHGVQQINYITHMSHLKQVFTAAFNTIIQNDIEFPIVEESLLNSLLFMKPLYGQMWRNDHYDDKNFTDEREWRYVPQITEHDHIDLVLPKMYYGMNTVYNSYSESIKGLRHLWLEFDFDDVEYIMVETKNDRNNLIDFIINNENININDRYELISKILVVDVISKDW